MTGIATVGFSPYDTLPANTLLRLSLADTEFFGLPGMFESNARTLYSQLYPRAHVIPTTQLYIGSDDKAAVIDGNLKQEMTGGALLSLLDDINGRFASVIRVERLSKDQKDASSGERGAEDRYNQASSISTQLESSSFVKQLAGALGTTAKVALAIAVAVIVVVLWHEFK